MAAAGMIQALTLNPVTELAEEPAAAPQKPGREEDPEEDKV